MPCGTGQDRAVDLSPLTAPSAARAPFRSGACSYTRLCGASFARAFPAHSRPRPEPGPFSGPPAVRVSDPTSASGYDALLRFALRLAAKLALRCVRPTSASHCFDYEHPRFVSYRHLFEACASPLTNELAFLAARRPVDRPFSRRPIRFGGPARVGARHCVAPCAPRRTRPLTPLSLPYRRPSAFARGGPVQVAKTAFDPYLREEEQAPQPEAPSIVRGHSRACANRS